jgi:hypothetical protein
MPRPRPPNLHREQNRHRAPTWYVRRGHGPRIRIRAAFGTPEFEVEYRTALDGTPPVEIHNKAAVGSLAWLWERYRETTAWTVLSLATRRQRENIMRGILKQSEPRTRPQSIACTWSPAGIVGRQPQRRLATSSMSCAVFSGGRSTPDTSKPIRR